MTSIPTRKIEMKTAIELAARLSARYLDTKQMLPDELAHEAAAMILQQTKQIDALKADAERYQWLRKHVVFGYCSPEGCNSDDVYLTITGYKAFPQTGKTVDAAIDAMKGKS